MKSCERIHELAKIVLFEVGVQTNNKTVINTLHNTGLAGYNNETHRIHIQPELVDKSVDLAPKTYEYDEGKNTLGVGGLPPFLYREKDLYALPATLKEFKHLKDVIAQNLDVVRFCSQWVKTRDATSFQANQVMNDLDCLKITSTALLNNINEVKWFAGRPDWHDSTCAIMSPLVVDDEMMDLVIRSIMVGNNMRLTTCPAVGWGTPNTPDGGLIITHAEIMFLLSFVQSIKPGALCILGGMPVVATQNGDMIYSHNATILLNVILAWTGMMLGIPTVQSGGANDRMVPGEDALQDGIKGRKILCDYIVHNARDCFGTLNKLLFFDEKSFIKDCEAQREYKSDGVVRSIHVPENKDVLETIIRVGSMNYHLDWHSTANMGSLENWAKTILN